MSIKNIIQQENDLQEMSTQSLANYLNNPTGQYNPYLVAGELQRKEAFAQRQAIEPPQGTVVDELVSQAMPMGGMPGPQPMPGPPMGGMPPPSQAGISSIPTPNMQPSFAAGGIVGYAEGEEVDYGDIAGDIAVDAGLMSMFGAPGFFMSPGTAEAATKYDDEEFAAMVNQDDTLAGAGVVGAGVVANEARKKANTKKAPTVKGKVPTVKGNKAGIAALIASKVPGASKLIDKATDYLRKVGTKPVAPKKLTKAERAKQSKIDKAKAKADKAAQKKAADLKGTPGGIDRALLNIGSKGLGGIASGAKAIGKGIYNNPIASGIGAIGVGGLGLYNEGQQKAQEAQDLAAQAERDEIRLAQEARALEAQQKTQAALDAQQAAREKRREKEMYLALALGGAKTMAGQSPFALTNIGEGLGTGVGALAAYDQNEMERMAASQAATLAAQQKMQLALMDEENNYRDRILKLLDTQEYQTFKRQLDEDFNEGDIEQKDYDLKLQDFMLPRVGLPPGSRSVDINGQQFTAVE
tara:strand:- start:1864 stop:3438 length:1575 start_codon:yes stop_codon:yes gene_type:complete